MGIKIFSNPYNKQTEQPDQPTEPHYEFANPTQCYLEPMYFPSLAYAICKEDISEKYLKLIKGLDKKSIQVVSRLINRIRKYEETKIPLFTLSQEEYNTLIDVRQWQENEIVKFEGKFHTMDNYIIEWNSFYENVFYHEHHIKELNNWDRSKDIIDVGAYTGESSLMFSKYLKGGGQIHAFEAVKSLYEMAKNTIKLNNITNVKLNNCGLLDKSIEKQMYTAGMSSCVEGAQNTEDFGLIMDNINQSVETVKCITLDQYVQENNISVGLIKCDIEGAEQLFLKGALNTIKTQKPAIIISIYHNAEDFFGIKPLIESWNLGYKFKIRKGDCQNIGHEIDLIAEVY